MATIITKNSSTAGAVPIAGDLVQGEIAVNVTDKKLYTKDSSGTVVEVSPTIINNASVTQAKLAANVAGNGPAFSAYQNAATTINTSTTTKIALQLEEFDTANAFDSTTNYRFMPQVAGYYQVNGCINFAPSAVGFRFIYIYKNGSNFKSGQNIVGGAVNFTQITISAIVYLNGSTDYIELYGNQNSGGSLATGGTSDIYFQAALIRSAT